jgi:hypothetical protein
MGLDQWLNRKVHIGAQYTSKKTKVKNIEIEIEDKTISLPTENLSDIEYQAMYWRKANQIHKWFVDKVQGGDDDCNNYDVSKDNMKALKELCVKVLDIQREVLKSHTEPEMCYKEMKKGIIEDLKKLLPCQEGFFFGNDEYGEYYFENVKETYDMLLVEEKFIEDNPELEIYYEYSSSW